MKEGFKRALEKFWRKKSINTWKKRKKKKNLDVVEKRCLKEK